MKTIAEIEYQRVYDIELNKIKQQFIEKTGKTIDDPSWTIQQLKEQLIKALFLTQTN